MTEEYSLPLSGTHPQSAPVRGPHIRRVRRCGAVVLTLLAVPLIAWGGLAGWTRINSWRAQRWMRAQPFTAEGVRKGCDAYTVGRGDCALLFVHGFADSPAVFANMAAELAGRGFTCRVMLLPGFGRTPAALSDVTLDDWKASVTAEARRLRRAHREVWIIGHSLGATVALESVADTPDLADGMALLAPLVGVSSARSPILPAQAWYRIASAVLPEGAVVYNALPIDVMDDKARSYSLRDCYFPLHVYGEVFKAAERMNASARQRVRVPVLVVLPARDRVTDRGMSVRLFESPGLPGNEVLRLSRSGHVVPLDAEWRLVADAIARLVRESEIGEARAPRPPGSA